MNTPTDKEIRDWYMGYGVEGRAELAEVEGNAFDRYLLERDARVAKETEERIIKLLEAKENQAMRAGQGKPMPERMEYLAVEVSIRQVIALIKGENK